MKTHALNNREKYPSHHARLSANKINVYSSVEINKGDTIDLNGKSFIVTDAKASKSTNPAHSKKVLFYEIDFQA